MSCVQAPRKVNSSKETTTKSYIQKTPSVMDYASPAWAFILKHPTNHTEQSPIND